MGWSAGLGNSPPHTQPYYCRAAHREQQQQQQLGQAYRAAAAPAPADSSECHVLPPRHTTCLQCSDIPARQAVLVLCAASIASRPTAGRGCAPERMASNAVGSLQPAKRRRQPRLMHAPAGRGGRSVSTAFHSAGQAIIIKYVHNSRRCPPASTTAASARRETDRLQLGQQQQQQQ